MTLGFSAFFGGAGTPPFPRCPGPVHHVSGPGGCGATRPGRHPTVGEEVGVSWPLVVAIGWNPVPPRLDVDHLSRKTGGCWWEYIYISMTENILGIPAINHQWEIYILGVGNTLCRWAWEDLPIGIYWNEQILFCLALAHFWTNPHHIGKRTILDYTITRLESIGTY